MLILLALGPCLFFRQICGFWRQHRRMMLASNCIPSRSIAWQLLQQHSILVHEFATSAHR